MGKLRPKRSDGTPSWRPIFIEQLALYGNVLMACKAVNIHRSTAFRARETNPQFAKQWSEALDDAADALELWAHKRARDPVTPSDNMTMFLLKRWRPEFREHFVQELTGAGGKDLLPPVMMLPPIAPGDA